MKTRREFMRFTLGSMACLGAAIVAPKVLMAEPKKGEWMISGVETGEWILGNPEPAQHKHHVTSGYVHVDHDGDYYAVPQTWTITASCTDEQVKQSGNWAVIKAKK